MSTVKYENLCPVGKYLSMGWGLTTFMKHLNTCKDCNNEKIPEENSTDSMGCDKNGNCSSTNKG